MQRTNVLENALVEQVLFWMSLFWVFFNRLWT